MAKIRESSNTYSQMVTGIAALLALTVGAGTVQAANVLNSCVSYCHGVPPRDAVRKGNPHFGSRSSAFLGNHRTHLPAAPAAAGCSICHAPVAATDFGHQNNVIRMANSLKGYSSAALRAKYDKGVFFNQTSIPNLTNARCSNVNCHFEKQTPVWGSAAAGTTCETCHGALVNPLTLAHPKHIAGLGNTITACASCHNNYAGAAAYTHATSAGRAIAVTVGAYTGSNNKYLPSQTGRVTGTCSTVACHGSGASLPWSGTLWSTTDQCGKCHSSTAAGAITQAVPFFGTAYPTKVTLNTNAKVGAHTNHMTSQVLGISASTACTDCHGTVALTGATHMNGSTTFVWSALATKSGALVPTYTAATGACANTYCHGASMPGGDASGTNRAPAWINPNYLPTTISAAACGVCHGFPPATASGHPAITIPAGFPATATIGTACSCHTNINTTGNSYANMFVNPGLHINGMVESQGCSGCHGWPPTTSAHTVHINDIIAEKALGSLPGGFLNNQVCGTCHNVSTLTKHAGDPGTDGTSRNIYLPTPSTLQASYQYGTSAVSYAKGGAETCSNISCHLGTSPAWGAPVATGGCQTCHGYPPVTTVGDADNKHVTGATPVNHIGTGATVNTKAAFVSVHGGCQICHGTQDSGTGTQTPHANYAVATQHGTGNINMNGPVGTGTGYDSTIRGCTAACHSSAAPYRMTASAKTFTFGDYGTGGDCLSCHDVASLASPNAAALGGPATRRNVVAEHKNLWSHKRSSAGGVPANTVVRAADCIVCHMEGDKASGSTTAVHKDGYIDLRDPDTGLQIKNVTWNGATPGAYVEGATNLRFVRFNRNLAVKLESDPNWLVIAAIQQNHCLKCHDTGGAANANAQVPTGGTALRPFGVAITGHTSSTIMNNVLGSVYDVKSNFLTTNASYHPVTGKQNNSFADIDMMTAPYNQAAKTAGTNTAYGDLISCWDCHAPAGASGAQTMTVTAHGGAATLRAPVFAGGNTAAANLCVVCHKTIYATTSGRHSTTLSAFSVGATDMSATTMAGCQNCHSNYTAISAASRPIRAEDVHGFNNKTPLTANSKWTSGSRPYAFYRTSRLGDWAPKSATGDTLARTSTCNSGGCSNGSMNGSNGIVGTGGTY